MGTKKKFFELLEEVSKGRSVSIEDVEGPLSIAIEKTYI